MGCLIFGSLICVMKHPNCELTLFVGMQTWWMSILKCNGLDHIRGASGIVALVGCQVLYCFLRIG